MKALFILPALLAALSSGCTAQQAYGTAQAWQRKQCNQLPDKTEFDRCMRNADVDYDSYKRHRDSEKK